MATFASVAPVKPTALVVDDDPQICGLVCDWLTAHDYEVERAEGAVAAHQKLSGQAYDCLILDLRLGDGDGQQVLEAAIERYPQLIVVVISGAGGVPDAVQVMRSGSIDFLCKPFQMAKLTNILTAEFERRRQRRENAMLRAELEARPAMPNLIAQSAAMLPVLRLIERIAPMNTPVLIQGETGTGKELIADTIHARSTRAKERMVAFNAAAVPESLAEAELFGHSRGAFTGAVNARVGRFELAHRGTIFIDEVALMSLPLQAKLLRVLQEKEIERLGESRPIKFDARVIVATNANLRKMVKEGTFREDLFYRLNVLPITLPPLRERREDIPALARHFLERSCRHNNLGQKRFSQETMRRLMAYQWPGNIRELENATEHAVAMSGPDDEIAENTLPMSVLEGPQEDFLLPTVTIPEEGLNFTSIVSQLERELITQCLQKTGGNKRRAARLLQLSRTTLIDKLHRLNPSSAA
jgi:DNA-binding NtrC family response regulator